METPSLKSKVLIGFSLLCIVIVGGFFAVKGLLGAPADFPTPYHLTIDPGQSLFSISRELDAARVIKSPRLFEMFMISLGE